MHRLNRNKELSKVHCELSEQVRKGADIGKKKDEEMERLRGVVADKEKDIAVLIEEKVKHG